MQYDVSLLSSWFFITLSFLCKVVSCYTEAGSWFSSDRVATLHWK